jgi:hypothetical protein
MNITFFGRFEQWDERIKGRKLVRKIGIRISEKRNRKLGGK